LPTKFSDSQGGKFLLTVREVARRLSVCTATIYRLCERGELAHTRVGAALRIAASDVDRYLASRRP
jgi:excisionase family DNA binding protein